MKMLLKLRKQYKKTQEEVAKAIYMDRSQYSKIENGKMGIAFDQILLLSKFYGISLAAFGSDNEELIVLTKNQYKLLIQVKNMIEDLERGQNITDNFKDSTINGDVVIGHNNIIKKK
ncbi:MAG: helix-turn-helix transcriptional regulator [Erysipelotrichaceae bacterium]|jgi:transcriptional regulator with XRE-family HTH domain|nr:helix-turn-helix transcriptional regulator [Erysipelotrichaceae bacterium]